VPESVKEGFWTVSKKKPLPVTYFGNIFVYQVSKHGVKVSKFIDILSGDVKLFRIMLAESDLKDKMWSG
jgi:hypothetical protein